MPGDLLVSEPAEVPQDHHLPTALGQREDRLEQHLQPLVAIPRLAGVTGLVEPRPLHALGDFVVGRPLLAAEEVDGGIARRGEEEGPRTRQTVGFPGTQGLQVNFLHEIVAVRQRRETRPQVRPQVGFAG